MGVDSLLDLSKSVPRIKWLFERLKWLCLRSSSPRIICKRAMSTVLTRPWEGVRLHKRQIRSSAAELIPDCSLLVPAVLVLWKS